MSTLPASGARPLPRILIIAGSGAICFHLFVLGVLALAAPSGPWPTAMGSSTALPPPFAQAVNESTTRYYLQPLYMSHNYHFSGNAPERPAVYFEVRLRDKTGATIKTLKFPDEKANFWVRQRQRILAQALGDDLPVQAPQGERVLPKGERFRTLTIWMGTEGDPVLRLQEVNELEIPRNRPVSRPSEWSLILFRSYVRYLCREHGAESAELIRHSRNAIYPSVLFMEPPLPRDVFEELICNFGVHRP